MAITMGVALRGPLLKSSFRDYVPKAWREDPVRRVPQRERQRAQGRRKRPVSRAHRQAKFKASRPGSLPVVYTTNPMARSRPRRGLIRSSRRSAQPSGIAGVDLSREVVVRNPMRTRRQRKARSPRHSPKPAMPGSPHAACAVVYVRNPMRLGSGGRGTVRKPLRGPRAGKQPRA